MLGELVLIPLVQVLLHGGISGTDVFVPLTHPGGSDSIFAHELFGRAEKEETVAE